MKVVVLAHLPPDNPGAFALQLQPGSDIGFVVEIGDDYLVASLEGAADREAEQAKKGGGVHAEGDLVVVPRIDKGGDAVACTCDGRVDFNALGIASAALHVAV